MAFTTSVDATVVAQESVEVEHVRLGWPDDPARSISIRWHTANGGELERARYRPAGATAWIEVPATIRTSDPDRGVEHEVLLSGLEPQSTYDYQISTDVDAWTDTRSFTTAPPDGGSFEAVYVADTGVVDRPDGLADGVAQVVDEINALEPLVVLGGGDYSYADRDVRFSDPSTGIDAWLAMMQPIISTAAFMPTFGNHEVLLEQNVDDWIDRFATPEGHDGRRSYSFDVAGVHFISLLAVETALDDETIAWLEADLVAATVDGARTIVPYLHRNVYGDGVGHPPSPSLSRQLTALFEQYDVDIVLTSHDQSYERTFPLSGGVPTTTSRSCFTSAEGITWIKTSPGGKLSNISWDFSPFSSTTPSPPIAVREGALHHYSVVSVDATDVVEVVTYGVTGDGALPIEVDRLRYAPSCGPEMYFETQPVAISAIADPVAERRTVDVNIFGDDPTTTLTTSAEWIEIVPSVVDGASSLTVDMAALNPGRHAGEIRAASASGMTATLPVVVDVRGTSVDTDAQLILRSGADRSGSLPLDGSRISGDAFIELLPGDQPVEEVRFTLDREPTNHDTEPPFDLIGGDRFIEPLDGSGLSTGMHSIEALMMDANGDTRTVLATFDVALTDVTDTEPEEVAPPSVVLADAPPGTETPWWASTSLLLGTLVAIGVLCAMGAVILDRRKRAVVSVANDEVDRRNE